MKTRHKMMIFALAAVPIIAGCSADDPNSLSDKSSIYGRSEVVSSAPFDTVSSLAEPDTPYLQYLGSRDITTSAAYELYLKSYAQNADKTVIEWEHVSEKRLSERLSELISSDLSPDLCDKLDNSLPYLSGKNFYEDLTEYIDITAPQWVSYSDYIISSSAGKGRYFYPTSITVSPNVLLYSKNRLSRYSVDPLALLQNGEWTIEKLKQAAGGTVGGSSTAENFLAASGTALFTVDRNGKVISNLHSEAFSETAAFVAENCVSADSSYYLEKGVEALKSGEYAFLSITESELDKIRRDYPESDLEIVPFPRSGSADKQYYSAATEGFLVPKRAKNIKGAASFINCSRIAESESSAAAFAHLSETDVKTLSEIRSADPSQLIFNTNFCLDSDANSSAGSIIFAMYSTGDDPDAFDEFIKSIEAPILRSINEINQSSE